MDDFNEDNWAQQEAAPAQDLTENDEANHEAEHVPDNSSNFFGEDSTTPASNAEPVIYNEPVIVQQNNYSFSEENDESPLRVYQRERNQRLEEKARKADQQHQQTLEVARTETEQFYQRRAEAKQKQHTNNLVLEKKFTEERDNTLVKNASGAAWDQVAFYIDFKRAVVGRDTTRLRKVLIDLKH